MKRNGIIFLSGIVSLSMLAGCNLSIPSINQNNSNSNGSHSIVDNQSAPDSVKDPSDTQNGSDDGKESSHETTPSQGSTYQGEKIEGSYDGGNFEFDFKHIVFNDKDLVFGSTVCKDIDDDFYGYISDEKRNVGYMVNAGLSDFLRCQPDNKSNSYDYSYDEVFFYFNNPDTSAKNFEDCTFSEIFWESKKYFRGVSLAESSDNEIYLGSGLTKYSTPEDFINVLGEPDDISDFTPDDPSMVPSRTYKWGDYWTKGYVLKAEFDDYDNLLFINMVGKVE